MSPGWDREALLASIRVAVVVLFTGPLLGVTWAFWRRPVTWRRGLTAAVAGQLAFALLAVLRGLVIGGNLNGIRRRVPGGLIGFLGFNLAIGLASGLLVVALFMAGRTLLRLVKPRSAMDHSPPA